MKNIMIVLLGLYMHGKTPKRDKCLNFVIEAYFMLVEKDGPSSINHVGSLSQMAHLAFSFNKIMFYLAILEMFLTMLGSINFFYKLAAYFSKNLQKPKSPHSRVFWITFISVVW